jgi:hypothetical protein
MKRRTCTILATLLLLAAWSATGCGSDTRNNNPSGSGGQGGSSSSTSATGSGGGSSSSGGVDGLKTTDKIDLLLVVDNSRSMADKQQVLQLTISDLVTGLTAVTDDVHLGVISSSLGGHGADACAALNVPSENDEAHLITRADAVAGGTVPSYDGLGFLAWDPNGNKNPAGENDIVQLTTNLAQLVAGAGEVGCGYESTQEAWYRFLVDPAPHDSISVVNNVAQLHGLDTTLLQQRADFLRPDSLLVVVVLSDENDCSVRDGGQFYFASQIYAPGTTNPYHLPKPRAACATDPNSPCCASCGQAPGNGCDTSNDDCDSGPLDPIDDAINLRCHDQKRRFGIDFLQPIDRYVTGLSSATVADRDGNLVNNPIFRDADGNLNPASVRASSLVMMVGIVGVPWQDVARLDASGNPDLAAGLDLSGAAVGGVMSGVELVLNGRYDTIVGDPDAYLPPSDPLMVESVDPRSGSNPITGDVIAGSTAGYLANPINGHEYSVPGRDDLQYACIFPLPATRDCTDPNQVACDCLDPNNDSPLCQSTSGLFGQVQYFAKAYPGVRHLQVLQQLGGRGVVGSVCPAQFTSPSANDYGYRPVMKTLIEVVENSVQQ